MQVLKTRLTSAQVRLCSTLLFYAIYETAVVVPEQSAATKHFAEPS